ncbi:hypothetical protein FJZ40_03195 [Candidatus Shapirobacteria bacterium]|nr:hypothetical protein [Candidatus Shapirobacteria bacterium]
MRDIEIIDKIRQYVKDWYSLKDLAQILPVKKTGLRTVVGRLVKRGVLQKINRGKYAVYGKNISPEKIACQIYYPSYLSLRTTLSRNGVINQIPRQIQLVTSRKSHRTYISGNEIVYRQIRPDLYWGYFQQSAYPEKALLDLLYYVSLGKDTISLNELDLSRLDKKRLQSFARKFPPRVRKIVSQLR